MGGGTRFGLWVVVVMLASRASADGVQVSIDWQGVRDRDVERCGLTRLRASVIERLVGEGYALVESAGASGVQVVLASSQDGLTLDVSSDRVARHDELSAGEPCDATFALDVIARVAELVDEVARARPSPPEPAPQPPATEVAAQPEPQASESRFIAAIDATARANQALSWLAGGGLSARLQLASGLQLGVRAELLASAHLEVTIIELVPLLTAAYQPSDALLGPCFELGPVVHLASSDARSVTELDATLGAGLQLSTGYFLAQLLAYARLRDFEHRVAGEIAHDSGRVGLALRVGAQL
jgi:hypothetical protein